MGFVWGVVRYVLSYNTHDECHVVGRDDASSDARRWLFSNGSCARLMIDGIRVVCYTVCIVV